MSNAATKAIYRRWIKLIFARWLAAFHISSRGCLSLRSEITVIVRRSQKNLEGSPQSRPSPRYRFVRVMTFSTSYPVPLIGTCRPMSQINPHSSRAIAAVTLL
jgi:hypothetical protein